MNEFTKEYDPNKVLYYVNICGRLEACPPFARGDWCKVEDFEELLEAYYELKNKVDQQ